MMNNEITDLIFADSILECEISHRKCHKNGKCSECLTASYFMSFEYDLRSMEI